MMRDQGMIFAATNRFSQTWKALEEFATNSETANLLNSRVKPVLRMTGKKK